MGWSNTVPKSGSRGLVGTIGTLAVGVSIGTALVVGFAGTAATLGLIVGAIGKPEIRARSCAMAAISSGGEGLAPWIVAANCCVAFVMRSAAEMVGVWRA